MPICWPGPGPWRADHALAWAVEGAGHYGLNLARHLAACGQQVAEISHTPHLGKRRAGKTDAIDALRAARELLAASHPAQPRADGDREALRLLIADRDHVVRACRSARALLAAVLVTMPGSLRQQLRSVPAARRARACAALTVPAGADRLTAIQHQTLARIGQRILALAAEGRQIETQISAIVEDLAPGLVAAEPGLGHLSAAQILLSFSHRGRIRSEAAFAQLAGTAPIPASSGADRPAPAQPRRGPPAQPRPAHRHHHQSPPSPAHQGLPGPPPDRRQNPARSHPLPQALPRPPPVPHLSHAASTPLDTHRSVTIMTGAGPAAASPRAWGRCCA